MAQIQVNHLTFYYEGNYEELFSDVSFAIDTDWKLGFVGRNGRGKTTFLNLLMGKYEYRGSISALVHFEYFPFQVKDKSRMTIDIAVSYTHLDVYKRQASLYLRPDEFPYGTQPEKQG